MGRARGIRRDISIAPGRKGRGRRGTGVENRRGMRSAGGKQVSRIQREFKAQSRARVRGRSGDGLHARGDSMVVISFEHGGDVGWPRVAKAV